MFSILGRPGLTCEGLTRREWLRVGGLGSLGAGLSGFGLPGLFAARGIEASARGSFGAGFGKAKSCIVLFMFGAPAHQDTWDLKPHAPADIRGEFQPIATNVPGIFVGEHIPRLAQRAHHYAQIRSVTHPDNTHTVAMHYMLTGVRHRRPETNPQNASDDFPCYGAVMRRLRSESAGANPNRGEHQPALHSLPASVSLNAPANQVSANNHIFPGFFAGFLGSAWDPLFVAQHAHQAQFEPLPVVESPARLIEGRRLQQYVERQARLLDHSAAARALDSTFQEAFRLLTSPAVRKTFNISDESDELRNKYGMTPFGQGCLLARRLVEAGVSLVTVNWERDDAYWDTHADNFNKHKKQLLPNMDQGFSALLDDLDQRGLLDETLVVWLGEFGRTPKINGQAGRDHWAACNTVIMAGGGIRGGQVYGASDRDAAYPLSNPIRPDDLSATIYHLLGVDPQTVLYTPAGQAMLLSHGDPILGLL